MATKTTTRRPTTRKPAAEGAEKFDPYQVITDQIIALLEAGTVPWRKPWSTDNQMPVSLSTGKVYRGINPFLLAMSSMAKGYTCNRWGSYKAIAAAGGQVRKGEKGTLIVFWKRFDTKEIDPTTGKPKAAVVLRTYSVFNAEQADIQGEDGVSFATKFEADEATVNVLDPIAECEASIAGYLATGPKVSFGASMAAYSPDSDALIMPDLATFSSAEEFYSTYFHELVHSTGHTSRLNRKEATTHAHFGSARYAQEELVAEMGSIMLSGLAGIAPAVIDNSAAYIANWVTALKNDKKMVVTAAAKAQRAADMVFGVSFAQEADTEAAA